MFMMIFSILCFVIVFVSSLSMNQWETSLFRAMISSCIGLVIGLLFSQLWTWINLDIKKSRPLPDQNNNGSERESTTKDFK